jgi:hypothetical protein
MLTTNEPNLNCVECHNEIIGQPYAFRGFLACENCVRNYYRDALPECITDELTIRARGAVRVVKDIERRHAKKQRGRFRRNTL